MSKQDSSPPSRAATLISALSLTYLPKEAGYIGILGRSSQLVKTTPNTSLSSPSSPSKPPRILAAQSHNYYMLTASNPINYLHWLESDDTHILVEGGPIEYFIFYPNGDGEVGVRVEKVTLGRTVEEGGGQRPVISVPEGSWKALKLCDGVEYALTVNVLAPEFTPDERVRIGEGKRWVERFIGKAEWATEEFLREVIGPNWIEEGDNADEELEVIKAQSTG